MLRRKIEEKLQFWFENRKQALLVKGARQVGKSFSISSFIKDKFENVIEIDFSKRTDLIDTFALLNNSDDLLLRLSIVAGDKMIENKTAVFLDEIQLVYQRRDKLKSKGELPSKSQDIISAMKSLVAKGQYRFILSGSLLGVAIKDINLNPTGYMDEYKMYPLDFEEFLWAKGVGEQVINYLKNCFEKRVPVDNSINEMFLKYFREYVLVGGMPEAVDAFISKNNLYLVNEAQSQIVNRYKVDITTYIDDDEGLKLRVRDIYNAIPSQLSSKNYRYVSSRVIDKQFLKNNNLEDEFLWLGAAGVALPVFNVTEPTIPLALSRERKTLKLFDNDVGLLISQLVDTGIREKLLNNEKVINYGAPYENAVAQELISHGFDEELFYYNSKAHGEVDFLVTLNNEVLPIEIKSGKLNEQQVYNHSALNNLLKTYNHPLAYVFGETNVVKENDVIYQMPIYMIDFIRK